MDVVSVYENEVSVCIDGVSTCIYSCGLSVYG